MIELKSIKDCNSLISKTIYEVCEDLEDGVWISTLKVESINDVYEKDDYDVYCILNCCSYIENSLYYPEEININSENESLFFKEEDAIKYALLIAENRLNKAKQDYDCLTNRRNVLKKYKND